MNNIMPLRIALRVTSNMQFYKYIMSEVTFVNGEQTKNEIEKLMHVSTVSLPNNLYGRKLEVFERKCRSDQYSTSDKEFLTRVHYIINDIQLITDDENKPKHIQKIEQIQIKAEEQIERLSKEYIGRSAKNWYILLRKMVEREDLLFKEIYKTKNWGLLLNSHYGKFAPQEIKEKQITLSGLVQNTLINIKEKSWVESIDNENIIVKVSAELDDVDDIERIKQKLRRLKVELTNTDKPILNLYNGSFKFQKQTGLFVDAHLSLEFGYGENYTKQLTYTINAIGHEEVK